MPDVVIVEGAQAEPAPAAEVTPEATQIAADAATEQTQIMADAAVEQMKLQTEAATEQTRLLADTSAGTSPEALTSLESRLSNLETKQATDHEAVCDTISALAGAETMDEQIAPSEGAIPVEKEAPEPKGEEKTDKDLAPTTRGFWATIFLGRPRK